MFFFLRWLGGVWLFDCWFVVVGVECIIGMDVLVGLDVGMRVRL